MSSGLFPIASAYGPSNNGKMEIIITIIMTHQDEQSISVWYRTGGKLHAFESRAHLSPKNMNDDGIVLLRILILSFHIYNL